MKVKLLTGPAPLKALPPPPRHLALPAPRDPESLRDAQASIDPGTPNVAQGASPGATAGPYLLQGTFAPKTTAELDQAAKALREAWPGGKGEEPEAFRALGESLQAYKQERLAALGTKPAPAALFKLLEEANILHGKPGHTQNLLAMLHAFLDDAGTRAALVRAAGAGSIGRLTDAARWLNLADLELPVRFLAVRFLDDAQRKQYIAPRAERAASMFRTLKLGPESLARLIEDHRPAEPRLRSVASEVLDLADQLAAMASKPFFQREGGGIDAPKLIAALQGNAKKAAIAPEVVAIFANAIDRGVADRGVLWSRERDFPIY